MKKITIIIGILLFGLHGFSQTSINTNSTRMYDSTRLSNDSVLVHYLNGAIKKRDTLKAFVKLNDSTIRFVTPKQMQDSLKQFVTGYIDLVNGHKIGDLVLKNGTLIPISESITSLIKSSASELTFTDENGIQHIIEVTPPFSLCDTLNSLPLVPFANGMKFVSTGGGSNVPSTWIGFDFDIPNEFPSSTDATDLYLHLIETPVTIYYYPPATVNPTTPISFLNTTAINAFIDQHIGDFGGVPGDIIVVVNNDNTITVWQNPTLTIGSIGMFWAGSSSPDNYTGKTYPTIPTTHTAPTGGGGCSLVELTACDLLATIPEQSYVSGSKSVFVGGSPQILNGDYFGWSLPENAGWNSEVFDSRVWALSINGIETNNLPAFSLNTFATSTYPKFQDLLDVYNSQFASNGNLFTLVAVGNDRILLGDANKNILVANDPYFTNNNYVDLRIDIIDNVTQSNWIVKGTAPQIINLNNVSYSSGGGCYIAELPQQTNISMSNDGFNNMSISDYGGTLSAPIISNNSLSLVGQNLTSNVNGVTSSITLPVAQLDSSTWNKVGTTLPSDNVTDDIYHTGAVGIGTNAPNEEVHVQKNQTSPTRILIDNVGPISATTSTSLGLGEGTLTYAEFRRFRDGSGRAEIGNLQNAPLNLFTNDLTRMTILGNGNIGIGTTAPNNNLHISTAVVPNTGGIRLPITSASADQVGSAIGVNASGDIVKIAGGGGGGATTNTLTNPTNTITSTVNGVVSTAPAVNTVVNTFTSPNLTTTVNGVASTATNLSTLYTVNNGLNLTAGVIRRGGNLVQNTTETLNGFTANVVGSIYSSVWDFDGRFGINSTLGTLGINTPLTVYASTAGRVARFQGLEVLGTNTAPSSTNAGIAGTANASATMNLFGSGNNTTQPAMFRFMNGNSLNGPGTTEILKRIAGESNLILASTDQLGTAIAFNPMSGSASFNALTLRHRIQQQGTANGITRGLYDNPTILSSTDYRAIETTVGKVVLNSTSGNTGIGTSTPAQKLHVIGNILATGTITPSDLRLKKDTLFASFGANEIQKLRPKYFKFKGTEQLGVDSTKQQLGFIAQDIESVYGSNSIETYDHYYQVPKVVSQSVYNATSQNDYIKEIKTYDIIDTTYVTDSLGNVSENYNIIGQGTKYCILGVKAVKSPNTNYVIASLVNAVKNNTMSISANTTIPANVDRVLLTNGNANITITISAINVQANPITFTRDQNSTGNVTIVNSLGQIQSRGGSLGNNTTLQGHNANGNGINHTFWSHDGVTIYR